MIETSKAFQQAIYAPSRMIKARARVEILDKTAFIDNTKTIIGEALISRSSQLTNKVRQASKKYATLEKDYTKLDGSFVIPPKTSSELPDDELGWWSDAICDSTSVFAIPQTVEFDFNSVHTSMGLTLYFDILNSEGADSFDIDVYDSSNNLIVHQAVTGNTEPIYVYINQLVNYKKVIITIKKWCKPYRRAKLVEVDFGVIKLYEDKHLMNVSLIQEVDNTSSTLPSDELKITVDNSNKEFDIMNPNGFYNFLKQGQEIFFEMGPQYDNGDIEYVQIGKYFLKEWQSDPSGGDNGTSTITLTARDIIDSLSDTEVENATVSSKTLYDLAVQVLTACGITDYELSDNLKSITTKSLYQKQSYRNLLQLIAIAGMCVVYSDNTGKFHMKQIINAKDVLNGIIVSSEAANISSKNQAIDNVLNPTFNVATLEKSRVPLDGSFAIPQEDMSNYETGWVSNDLSGSDNAFSTPQMITLTTSEEHSSTNLQILFDVINNEYATDFTIQGFDANNNSVFSENITGNTQNTYLYQNNLIANCRKYIITINKWSKPYRRARILEIGFDFPLDNITLDNMYSVPKIALNEAVKSVEVTYYTGNDLNTKSIYTATDNTIEKGATLTVDNSLINTLADAQNVANWLLKENKQCVNFEIDWRQNPALCPTDKVSVENNFNVHSIGNIIKQQFTYTGYLRSTTNVLGAI